MKNWFLNRDRDDFKDVYLSVWNIGRKLDDENKDLKAELEKNIAARSKFKKMYEPALKSDYTNF